MTLSLRPVNKSFMQKKGLKMNRRVAAIAAMRRKEAVKAVKARELNGKCMKPYVQNAV